MTDIVNELRATQYDKDNFPRMKSEWACSVGLALRAADEIERLRAALKGLLACPAIADGNHNEPAWACPETAEAERIARAALENKP